MEIIYKVLASINLINAITMLMFFYKELDSKSYFLFLYLFMAVFSLSAFFYIIDDIRR